MARQEELIAQTIANMKRAMLRKADDSESDDSIKATSNRGNKLKRKAKYVEEGRLDIANSFRANKRRINYNGYFREIISRNPLRVDPDGDVVDPEDDDVSLELEDFEEDPYQNVHIEKLLMPLTSAADLKSHPTLSLPYTSKILDEMLQNARDMVFREEQALWKIKKLFSEFRGDSTWMPVGNFETDNDLALFGPVTTNPSLAPSVVTDVGPEQSAIARWDAISDGQLGTATDDGTDFATKQKDATASNASMDDSLPHDAYEAPKLDMQGNGDLDLRSNHTSLDEQNMEDRQRALHPNREEEAGHDQVNGKSSSHNEPDGLLRLKQEERISNSTATSEKADTDPIQGSQNSLDQTVNGGLEDTQMHDTAGTQQSNEEDNEDQGEQDNEDGTAQPPHRMTTRAKAQAATSPNPNSPLDPSTPHYIHPIFQPPLAALSTREFGLSYDEADETRRLLWAYVQKQEEICRAATRICNGLLKAQRLRDDVLEWCQAEGHVGEMSDGEDWYDREKWGLEQDLKKGEELDEEDVTVSGKKTRHRRTARDA